MNGVLRIGGPLAIRCPTCRRAPEQVCWTMVGARATPWARKSPHAARLAAAPPEAEVKVGDLVIAQPGIDSGSELLAHVVSIPDCARVRFWLGDGFSTLRIAFRHMILRLAPEDETAAAARAALAVEHAR